MRREDNIKKEVKVRETYTKIGFIKRKQDYATELFGLSRPTPEEVDPRETEMICICQRAWCGDVASYIAELENEVLRLHKEEE